ncbi:DUF3142 domain-containing protein [Klebsiella pneumoniae subsp. pneumoniae]|nr:DUF3142 domain-containing protein [Klebsiella pneumoniae subsp. pneumoniae]
MRLSLLTLSRAPGLWFRALSLPRDSPPALESESPLWIAAGKQELERFHRGKSTRLPRELEQQSPHHFSGIVCVSSASDNDTRAWSLSTLAAVIRHQPLTPRWQWLALPDKASASAESTLYELAIKNTGNIDALLPAKITLTTEDCLAADGAGSYRFIEQTFSSPPLRCQLRRADASHWLGKMLNATTRKVSC